MAVELHKGRSRMQHMYHIKSREKGFTIVELLLAVSLSVVVIGVFIGIIMTSYLRFGRNTIQLELNGNLQNALVDVERDIRFSTTYATGLPTPFVDTNAPSGGWTHRGTPSDANKRVLVLKASATTNNPYSPSRAPIYVNGGVTNPYITQDPLLNCSNIPPLGTLYINPQLPFYIIYFVENNNLYRRIVVDSSTTVCNGAQQYQKQSCPTGTGGSCTVKDEIIATDVTRFSVNYYQQTDDPTPTFVLLDPYKTVSPDDLALADNLQVTIGLQRTIDSVPVAAELSVTATRINEL